MITKLFVKKNINKIDLEKYLDQYYGVDKTYYIQMDEKYIITIIQDKGSLLTSTQIKEFIQLDLGWLFILNHHEFNPKVITIKHRNKQ